MSDDRKGQPSRPAEEERGGPSPRKRWVRSEQPILEDGQLGGANLDKGPERRNPEGTADRPNPPTDER